MNIIDTLSQSSGGPIAFRISNLFICLFIYLFLFSYLFICLFFNFFAQNLRISLATSE